MKSGNTLNRIQELMETVEDRGIIVNSTFRTREMNDNMHNVNIDEKHYNNSTSRVIIIVSCAGINDTIIKVSKHPIKEKPYYQRDSKGKLKRF